MSQPLRVWITKAHSLISPQAKFLILQKYLLDSLFTTAELLKNLENNGMEEIDLMTPSPAELS